jgi:Kef-type K+ transport system membrane component KefB
VTAAPALSGTAVLAFVLFGIALILLAARLVGGLFARIGQPRVVGEIVAGILLGPTFLGPTLLGWDTPWTFLRCEAALAALGAAPSVSSCLFPPQSQAVLGVIGQIGLTLYIFLVGLEVDWDALKGKLPTIALVATGSVGIPIAGAFALLPLLYDARFVAAFGEVGQPSRGAFALMTGAMLSVTAFPVMARILQERGMTASPLGVIGVAAAAAVTVLMFMVVSAASGLAAGAQPVELVLRLAAAIGYIAVMFVVVRPVLRRLGDRYEQHSARLGRTDGLLWSEREAGVGGPLTTEMFAAIMVLVFVSAGVAHVLGLTVIVGGFLAGVVLPVRGPLIRDMTVELFDLVAVVLLPIFLAFSGLQTDFTRLQAAALPGIAIFLLAGILTKWGGGAIVGRAAGLSWREGNVLGVLLNCRGLLVLVVGLIAVQQNVITGSLQIGAVVMALVTTAMTGPLFDIAQRDLARPVSAPPAPPAGTAP